MANILNAGNVNNKNSQKRNTSKGMKFNAPNQPAFKQTEVESKPKVEEPKEEAEVIDTPTEVVENNDAPVNDGEDEVIDVNEVEVVEETPKKASKPIKSVPKDVRDKRIEEAARKLAEKKYRDVVEYDYNESLKLITGLKKLVNTGYNGMIILMLFIKCNENDPDCDDGFGEPLFIEDEFCRTFVKENSYIFYNAKDAYEFFMEDVMYLEHGREENGDVAAIKLFTEDVSIQAESLFAVYSVNMMSNAMNHVKYDKIPTSTLIEDFDFFEEEDGSLSYALKENEEEIEFED